MRPGALAEFHVWALENGVSVTHLALKQEQAEAALSRALSLAGRNRVPAYRQRDTLTGNGSVVFVNAASLIQGKGLDHCNFVTIEKHQEISQFLLDEIGLMTSNVNGLGTGIIYG